MRNWVIVLIVFMLLLFTGALILLYIKYQNEKKKAEQNKKQQGGLSSVLSGVGSLVTSIGGGAGSALSGLKGGEAASIIAMLSERSSKENIEKIGTLGRLNVYKFNYKGENEQRKGFIVDEVEKIYPDCIITINGLRYINYNKLKGYLS
jgi:hypothetical protein